MRHLLLVEDDPLVRRALGRLLTMSGFAVDEAASAAEALESLRSQSFACILTDFHLPKHDGLWLLAEARRAQPGAIRILCSGGSVDRQCLDPGLVNGMLEKPFQVDELLSMLPRIA